MARRASEIIGIVFFVIAIITALIAVILLLIKIFGNSPDTVTILLWIVASFVAMQIAVFSMLFPIRGSLGRLEEFKEHSREFQKQTIREIRGIKEGILGMKK